jgi:hypothetical protein
VGDFGDKSTESLGSASLLFVCLFFACEIWQLMFQNLSK